MPCGTGKADFVKGWFGLDSLTDRMVLFDDLFANLHEWKAAGVKCYNGINGTHGTWRWDGVMWSSDLRATLWMPVA